MQGSRLQQDKTVVVVGAGIGGLAAALRLVSEGHPVTVVERQATPGGKMRQVPSAAGPVDAGPTVLTMRHVFDDLFARAGTALDDHVTLFRQDVLARHWWPDSGPLDLYADRQRSSTAVAAFAGHRAQAEFDRFCRRAQALFDGFRAPVMEAPTLSLVGLTRHVLANPSLIPAMAPTATLARQLARDFSDPRLQQLFGRYATYVGGSPYRAPALLSLIWNAEEAGVWVVKGGLHALAKAMAKLIVQRGGTVLCGSGVAEICTRHGAVSDVVLESGQALPADTVVFNGDPRALATGRLGPGVSTVAPQTRKTGRSLSAQVWSFASAVDGPDLAHHNVFFCADPRAEFAALERGHLPDDTTLYLCAEDRGQDCPPPRQERFEIILNAPPLTNHTPADTEFDQCHRRTFPALKRFGLRFATEPGKAALTTPPGFETLFPGSAGSLYGQSPHGMTAALRRPTARTAIKGLYLCGGGCHPGAGVPMAATSGRHAAEAILTDRISTLPSRRTAMHGGMSTRSPIAAPARFRSSDS